MSSPGGKNLKFMSFDFLSHLLSYLKTLSSEDRVRHLEGNWEIWLQKINIGESLDFETLYDHISTKLN